MNFFDNTPFLESSHTGTSPNRLNWRCELLLRQNAGLIHGKRVLDLASHDGRFTWACLKIGAAHVVGVEARSHLVRHAEANLRQLGVTDGTFQLISQDVFDYLPTVAEGAFDTVLCFGLFYHLTEQLRLLSEIRRINPQSLILDTALLPVDLEIREFNRKPSLGSFIVFHEDTEDEANTIDLGRIVFVPTRRLVSNLLPRYGFEAQEIDWLLSGITNWTGIEDYRSGFRGSFLGQGRSRGDKDSPADGTSATVPERMSGL